VGALGRTVTLRGGVLNLTDQKYFEWQNVRERSATDPTIDRYSSPGVRALLELMARASHRFQSSEEAAVSPERMH